MHVRVCVYMCMAVAILGPPASKHTLQKGIRRVETKTHMNKQLPLTWSQLCVVVVLAFEHF